MKKRCTFSSAKKTTPMWFVLKKRFRNLKVNVDDSFLDIMIKEIRFFKQDGIWYADVPEHTLEENEMVAGSDRFLDDISCNSNEVIMRISTEEPESDYVAHLKMIEHDSVGASYKVISALEVPEKVWICNVTHTVLGEHPENIYILSM